MTSHNQEQASGFDIAVIGLSGRFPGMGSVEGLWRGLREGREGVRRFTEEELLSAGVDQETLSDAHYVRAGALLEDADVFDAEFFGFTPREAEILDPQQRILLECSWEALERAGYDPWRFRGSIGAYVGASISIYLLRYLSSNRELLGKVGSLQALLSNDKDFLATRLAYKLNLRGPGLTVQTACSTSLVAVHLACQALIGGECDLALAGGVSITSYKGEGYRHQPGGLLSADGRCRPFDAGATGTVSGNGAGVVVLKRLGEALSDGDRIHAVIRGSAINNDGAVKAGYTAPGVEGQATAIRIAHLASRVAPATIGYVEAHGSGTELGDPIEAAALREAFGECGGRRQFCALGSVKSNIGHLDAAAGVAGLIKAVLAVREGEIPASLHFETPNPKIDFERSPFYVNTELRRWEAGGGERRRAGVSSFGIGGTNAHVVLEQAPEMPARSEQRGGVELLVLSARTGTALAEGRRRLADHLESHDEELGDVAWTLQVGRREFRHREAIVCGSREQAIRGLRGEDASAVISGLAPEQPRPVSLLLGGAGDQYAGMGKGLHELGGRYREELERCCELLRCESGEDVLGELHRDHGGSKDVLRAWRRGESVDAGRLGETVLGQSAVFAVDYALAQMWMQWGIRPKALLGYSLGEYAAACLAGVMSLEDAVRVVVNRARLIARAPAGAMTTVGLDADEAEPYLSGRLEVAIDSGKGACVVGGPVEQVESLERKLGEQGVVCRRQQGSCAMHTRMMKPVATLLEEVLRGVRLREPQLGYIGNLSGRLVQPGELTSTGYWTAHLWQRVRFRQGLEELLQDEGAVLLEVGPGQSLSSFAQQTSLAKGRPALVTGSLRNRHEEWSDEEYLRRSTGKLWTGGIAVDWKEMHGGASRRRVELPTYAFEGKRYWAGVEEGEEKKLPSMELKKLADPAQWLYAPTWKRSTQARREQEESAVRWLVFSDGSAVSRALVSRLADVEVVDGDDALAKTGEHTWTIHPDRREDYSALFDRLQAEGRLPDRIVYLWNLRDPAEDEFFSFFFLSQALGEIDYAREMRLFVVSSGTELIEASDEIEPNRCLLKGICRALPQEYGNLQCRHIDVRLAGEPEDLAAAIVGELRSEETEEFVGLRGRYRWVPGYASVQTDRAAGEAKLRRHGVYLITGGMGGMGLTLAGYLARTQQARLVLVGWRGLPEREQWQGWLEEHGPDEETSRRIAQIREMERNGSEVLVLEADVADLEQMREVVERTHLRFGAIHGVIHAAGLAGGGLLQVRTVDAVRRVLRPKVAGTRELWRAVAPDAPDFLLLCSSLGSILGGIGQADYYAANAYQDAFALSLDNSSTTVVAVNWDVWKDVGMALRGNDAGGLAKMRDEAIQLGITPLQGVDVFTRILGAGESQIVTSTQDLHQRLEWHRHVSLTGLNQQLEQVQFSTEQTGREGLSSEWVAPRNLLEARVLQVWEGVLGRKGIGVNDNFFELGGNSLMGIQLLHRLREMTGASLPLRSLFSAPTVASLSKDLGSSEVTSRTSPLEFIVPLGPQKTSPPWFFVHPIGGGASCYFDLAQRLSGDQTAYGIKAAELVTLWGPNGEHRAPDDEAKSIPELAAQYLEAIRIVQPQGPYYLGGWSFGGVVAFEMARQLEAEGQPIAILLILDSSINQSPSTQQNPDRIDYATACEISQASGRDLTIGRDEFEQLIFEQQIECLLDHLRIIYGLTAEAGVGLVTRLVRSIRSRYEAYLRYRPETFAGRMVLVRAGGDIEIEYSVSQDPALTNGWASVVKDPITVFTVPGDHLSIIYPPYIDNVTFCLNAFLEESGKNSVPLFSSFLPEQAVSQIAGATN